MGFIVSIIGQKGGVGKSTVARAFAVEAALRNTKVVIVDLDYNQKTSMEWAAQRKANNISPEIKVIDPPRAELDRAIKGYDLTIIDSAGFTSDLTLWLAEKSHLVVLPTNATTDDLKPTIRLAHELISNDIPRQNIAFVLSKIHNDKEEAFARDYLKQAGYQAVEGYISQRQSLGQAQNEGRAITELPNAKLKDSVFQVIENLGLQLQNTQAFVPRSLSMPARTLEQSKEGGFEHE